MLRHFLPALCWAVVLAIATTSVYDRWLVRFTRQASPLWAAITFTTLVGIVLIVPMVYGGVIAAREAISLVRTYADSSADGELALPDWVEPVAVAAGLAAGRFWADRFGTGRRRGAAPRCWCRSGRGCSGCRWRGA